MAAAAIARVWRFGFLALIGLACVGPAAWVVLSSFKTQPQIFGRGNMLPSPFTLRGYETLFAEIDVARYLLNSTLYAVGGTAGAVFTGLLAAYPAARMRFPLRRALTVTFSVGLAIPVTGLIVPEFVIVRDLGLFDSKLGMIIFYNAMWFPLAFVILRVYLTSLPPSIEEAAAIDGANYFQLMRRIILPLAGPGLATAAVLIFINIWNDFLFNLLLAPSDENQNVQVALTLFRGQFRTDIVAILAGTTVMMIIPIITFVVLQRYVIDGLTARSSR